MDLASLIDLPNRIVGTTENIENSNSVAAKLHFLEVFGEQSKIYEKPNG